MRRLEQAEQIALFHWANMSVNRYPELECMFAIPNGASTSGKRISFKGSDGKKRSTTLTAIRLKQEGLKAGIPDICLAVARGGCHSLFIEMKAKGGTVTPIQRKVHERLRENGFMVEVCYSFEAAKSIIILYLGMSKW